MSLMNTAVSPSYQVGICKLFLCSVDQVSCDATTTAAPTTIPTDNPMTDNPLTDTGEIPETTFEGNTITTTEVNPSTPTGFAGNNMTDVIVGVVVTLVLLILIILVVITLTLFLLKRRMALKSVKVASAPGSSDFNNPNYEVGEWDSHVKHISLSQP